MAVCFLIFGYSTFDAKSRGHHDGIKGIIATESSDKNFDDRHAQDLSCKRRFPESKSSE